MWSARVKPSSATEAELVEKINIHPVAEETGYDSPAIQIRVEDISRLSTLMCYIITVPRSLFLWQLRIVYVVMIISEWWQDPLADDIYQTFRDKELRIPTYLSQSPQLHQRRYLVDWAAEICDQFTLCPTTRHLAVHLLDYFMDNFFLDLDKIFLVVLGCILVASKFEEKETSIPRWPQLNAYIHNSLFTGIDFVQMEITLLSFFNWQVGIPTPAHFTDYFLMVTLKAIMVHCESPNWVNQIQYFMAKYVNYFLEISLQDHSYRDYRPSLVAAASITASRICLNVPPSWPKEMEKASGYKWEDIEKPVMQMLESQQVDRSNDDDQKLTPPSKLPAKTPDSGYRSEVE